jgi:hypothetical protein
MKALFNKKSNDQSDQATIREVALEERILRSVNNQVDVVMAKVQATTIK